jgi:septation ring formation regulator EzrA
MIAIVGIVCLTVMVIAFMYFNRQSEKDHINKPEKERKLDS